MVGRSSKLGLASLVAGGLLEALAVRNSGAEQHLALDLGAREGLHSQPEQLTGEELPLCKTVAESTYPGFCDPAVSGFACYATEAKYTPAHRPDAVIDVQWACSLGKEAEGITTESCRNRPWEYKGPASDGGAEVVFVAHDIYSGACRFDGAVEVETIYPPVVSDQDNKPATVSTEADENKKPVQKPDAVTDDAGQDTKPVQKPDAVTDGAGQDTKPDQKPDANTDGAGQDTKPDQKPDANTDDAGQDKKPDQKPDANTDNAGQDTKPVQKPDANTDDAGQDKKPAQKPDAVTVGAGEEATSANSAVATAAQPNGGADAGTADTNSTADTNITTDKNSALGARAWSASALAGFSLAILAGHAQL